MSYIETILELINEYEKYKKEKIEFFEREIYVDINKDIEVIKNMFKEYDNIFNTPKEQIKINYNSSIKIYNEIKRNMEEKENQKYEERFKKIHDNLTNLNTQSDDSIDEETKQEKDILNKSIDTIEEVDENENEENAISEKEKDENENEEENSISEEEKEENENNKKNIFDLYKEYFHKN